MPHVKTGLLDVGYETGGPHTAPVVLLLHGWPDDARAFSIIAPQLNAAGFRTVTPFLRGFGPTRFLSADNFRDGSGVALAQDAIDLTDALGIERFAVVGHDWGARAAYILAALFPERVTSICALALAYQPRGAFKLPSFSQSRLFWYQWFMTLEQGADAVRRNPKGFARLQWDTWSPPGWFDDAEFEATAKSFENPDWTSITLNAYRARWGVEPSDPRYDALRVKLSCIETLRAPTLMIQGGADMCDEPAGSEDMEKFFAGSYRRVLLEGVGHFPTREAPQAVVAALITHLQTLPAD